MKCPKCGYLGFEDVERCRNCGYDFSLAQALKLPELPMRGDDAQNVRLLDDLELIDAAASSQPVALPHQITPDLERLVGGFDSEPPSAELLLFAIADEVPLITKASPPRPPLAVRRATPEASRLRSEQLRMPALDLVVPELGAPPMAALAPRAGAADWGSPADHTLAEPAGLGTRVLAVAIDLLILAAVDSVVIYFTMEICGLTVQDLGILPKSPLVAFLLVQNGGYLVAFTVGGQTLGKMAAGIKVVSARPNASLDLGHSMLRTLLWLVLATPAGLGFLTALFSRDRRGLHDRCAGTRVVRVSAG